MPARSVFQRLSARALCRTLTSIGGGWRAPASIKATMSKVRTSYTLIGFTSSFVLTYFGLASFLELQELLDADAAIAMTGYSDRIFGVAVPDPEGQGYSAVMGAVHGDDARIMCTKSNAMEPEAAARNDMDEAAAVETIEEEESDMTAYISQKLHPSRLRSMKQDMESGNFTLEQAKDGSTMTLQVAPSSAGTFIKLYVFRFGDPLLVSDGLASW